MDSGIFPTLRSALSEELNCQKRLAPVLCTCSEQAIKDLMTLKVKVYYNKTCRGYGYHDSKS